MLALRVMRARCPSTLRVVRYEELTLSAHDAAADNGVERR